MVFTTSAQTDLMTPFQRLKDDQMLVSVSQEFEMGFFSPSGQTGIRYLGIWYKDITPLTVVWVANRIKPLKNFDATLMLDFNGTLSLKDHAHNTVLLSMPAKEAIKPVLQLLDSGNLVVREDGDLSDGGYIWQSFDYPCDTLLPEMKIGWDYKTGRNQIITSWKNSDDPSPGEFTLGLDKPQLPQLVLERIWTKQARWGPWDGAQFSGSNALGTNPNPMFKPMFETNGNGTYFSFDVLDVSIRVIFVVTHWGKVEFLTWKNYTREWVPIVTLNRDTCDGYGSCGPYGICSVDEPYCQCLKGFTAHVSGDWSLMDWTGGCKRNFELKCGDGDGFVNYKGLKLPDNATVWANLGSEECEKTCLQDCNCMGYSSIDVYGNGSTCVVWLNELYDMRNFPQGGDELYIRMARAELGMSR
ncbi:G-type lectin S-receptor-like serine/threonine-protein kinase At4g27290 [Actinidia eriantha]|uniref:G-type lectin S-receptor-like serine/threonine-protein kinase At4g27290 n=1 Tax=Actinidia eriantha TaxID=165200 RepID=UPI0025877B54|nr:G-type lectin S-receptor-like serine/threonine-protein kinase At4g27290 [Actinidia eriantha]